MVILSTLMLIFAILGVIAICVMKKYFVNETDSYFDIIYTLAIFISTSLFWSIIGYILTFFIQT